MYIYVNNKRPCNYFIDVFHLITHPKTNISQYQAAEVWVLFVQNHKSKFDPRRAPAKNKGSPWSKLGATREGANQMGAIGGLPE